MPKSQQPSVASAVTDSSALQNENIILRNIIVDLVMENKQLKEEKAALQMEKKNLEGEIQRSSLRAKDYEQSRVDSMESIRHLEDKIKALKIEFGTTIHHYQLITDSNKAHISNLELQMAHLQAKTDQWPSALFTPIPAAAGHASYYSSQVPQTLFVPPTPPYSPPENYGFAHLQGQTGAGSSQQSGLHWSAGPRHHRNDSKGSITHSTPRKDNYSPGGGSPRRNYRQVKNFQGSNTVGSTEIPPASPDSSRSSPYPSYSFSVASLVAASGGSPLHTLKTHLASDAETGVSEGVQKGAGVGAGTEAASASLSAPLLTKKPELA